MLTRQIALLLVGAMHFVAVRASITKKVSPNMCIIKNFDVGGTIHQFLHVQTFGVRTWCKLALKSDSPWLTSTRIPYSARIGLPVRQYIMGAGEAARKPIQRPRTKSTETDCQKTDGMPWNS